MEPTFGGLDRMGTFTVLALFYRVVEAAADDFLRADHSMLHAVHKGPADSFPTSSVDKTILGTGVKGVFAVHELRVQDNIALLAG